MNFQKILVAIGVTTRTSPILERAITLAKNEGAALMLFHCHEPQTMAEYEDHIVTLTELDVSRSQRSYERCVNGEIGRLRSWLEELCDQAKKEGVAARSLVEEGKPGPRIVEHANHWGADLIMLGRTQRGSFADVLLGTVSDYVIHHASCSLLLVQ